MDEPVEMVDKNPEKHTVQIAYHIVWCYMSRIFIAEKKVWHSEKLWGLEIAQTEKALWRSVDILISMSAELTQNMNSMHTQSHTLLDKVFYCAHQRKWNTAKEHWADSSNASEQSHATKICKSFDLGQRLLLCTS